MAGSDDETVVEPLPTLRDAGELRPGTLLNGIYRIESRLGVGGMGEVYRATNLANDEQDAIKIIGRGRADQEFIEGMFRKEARVLSRIRSPAVAQLKLFMRDPALDLLYFITDFVAGESLLDRLKRQPARGDELRALMCRMLTGLQAVHDAGAVHRDLSPDNIILPDGDVTQAKIIDFGIAKELDPSHTTMVGDGFAGKLGYIAPEQLGFTGAKVGPWTDLYSLALVGVAFAAGRPLDMGHTMGRAEEARRGAIDLSAVPDDLRPVFAWLLTYDWRTRPQSAAEVLAALAPGGPMPPPAPSWAPPAYDPPPMDGYASHGTQTQWPDPHSVPPVAPAWRGAAPAVGSGSPTYKAIWIGLACLAVLAVLIVAFIVYAIQTAPDDTASATPGRQLAEPNVPIQCLPSNVCYQQVAAGDGKAHPTIDDAVDVRMSAREPNGTESYAEHAQQLMVSGRQMGFEEVLPLMTVGEHMRVWATPSFSEGDTVVYDVTLVDIDHLGRDGNDGTPR